MFSLPINIEGISGRTSAVEYTSLSLYDAYSQAVQTIRTVIGSGTPPSASDLTNLSAAINALRNLFEKGATSTDPSQPSQQYLTTGMAEALQPLFGALQVVGFSPALLQNPSSGVSLTTDQVTRLQDILNPTNLLDGLYAQVYLIQNGTITNTLVTTDFQHSLQAEVELVFVKTGNDVLSSQLVSLEQALSVTKSSIDNLSNMQTLHNNINVYDRGSFTAITGFDLAGPSFNGNTNAYQSAYEAAASAFFGQSPPTQGAYQIKADFLIWQYQLLQAGGTSAVTNMGQYNAKIFTVGGSVPFPPYTAYLRYGFQAIDSNGNLVLNGDYNQDNYNQLLQDFNSGKYTKLAIIDPNFNIWDKDINAMNSVINQIHYEGTNLVLRFPPTNSVSFSDFVNLYTDPNVVPDYGSITTLTSPTLVPVIPGSNPYAFDSFNSFASVMIAGLLANPNGYSVGSNGHAILTVPDSVITALPAGYADAFQAHYGCTRTDDGTNTTFVTGTDPAAENQLKLDIVPVQAVIAQHAVHVDLVSTSPTYGELIINPSAPSDKYGTSQAFAQTLVSYFGMLQPAMSAVKNQLVSARVALSAQITALSAIASLAGADPDASFMLQSLKQVRADLAASFRTSSGEVTQATSLRSAMSGLEAWLFDNYNKRNTPDAAIAGLYQNNLTQAITASQSLNDTQKSQVQRYLFVFEDYYKSASSILQKLTQIIKDVARHAGH